MSNIIQLLVSGIAMGFVYCLVAVEYTLIWNATGLINFAHERFIVLGAFCFGGFVTRYFAGNYIIGTVLTLLFMMVFGMIVAVIVINPLRDMPSTIFSVMGMLMTGYIMREAIRLIWGASPFTVPGFLSGTFHIGEAVLPRVNIIIIVISVLLLIIQKLFMTKTKLGKAVRCVAQDKEAASLMGINVKKNIAITVGISSMICGLIGILVIPVFSASHTMASLIALKGFAAGVIGGFGTYSGALVGGLLIGIFENMYLLRGPSIYKDVVAFVLLIVVLMLRPTGIMGEKTGGRHRLLKKRKGGADHE